MAIPFDTLKLARQFEAAGFEAKQAGDMAAAISDAMMTADLATKSDLRELEQRLIIRLSTAMVVVAGLASTIVHFWR